MDSGAIAAEIKTILEGLTGMGTVTVGAPEAIPTTVGAYVTMGSQTTEREAAGVFRRSTRFFVLFAYRVDGAEATAETTMMGLVDAFVGAIYADLTLGGTALAAAVDSMAADAPDYQMRAGKEFREYPVIVTADERGSYAVNP
jgi:hypothetical protein